MTELSRSLARLSSAEEFLEFFGIPYEQPVLNVSRLHILKRFYQYLRQEDDLARRAEAEQHSRYAELLARAYRDFVESSPAREKVFKVFQDADGRQHISAEALRRSLARPGT